MPKGCQGFQKGNTLGSVNLGRKLSEETLIKKSIASKGRHFSPKTEFKKGNKLSEETKKKMSIWRKEHGIKPPNHKGEHYSKEHRKHMSEARLNGREPKSPLNHRIRSSIEYKLWRTAVFERDNYTCIWCGARNGNGKTIVLNADHIKPFAFFPELRFAIDNGRTLCVECHKKTDTFQGRVYKIYGYIHRR